MATSVIMPRQGQSVESCTIGMWHKKKGDKVSVGDILFSYETDKASFDEEAKTEGFVLAVFFEEGDEVECLQTVCVIGAEGEDIEGFGICSPTGKEGARSQGTPSEPEAAQPGFDSACPGEPPAMRNDFLAGTASPGEPPAMHNRAPVGAASPGEPPAMRNRAPAGAGPAAHGSFAARGPQPGFPRPPSPAPTGEIRISPRARALAEITGADAGCAVPTGADGRIMENDIRKVIAEGRMYTRAAQSEITSLRGSGIGGRFTALDLEALQTGAATPFSADPAPAPAPFPANPAPAPASPEGWMDFAFSAASSDFEEVKLTKVRKYVAQVMHASIAGSAQLTHHTSFDATDILNFRKDLKRDAGLDGKANITVTDIIVYAASRVLPKHRSLNAYFLGDRMAQCRNTHIGVAVDTPRGVLVPTVFNVNELSLTELAARAKGLFEKCKQGAVDPDLLKGASFTITNLGGLGVEMFTPILNPPQTGILGVCCIVERIKNGAVYPAMGLSLTYDHRALDGADAARFQKDIGEYLENFSTILMLEGGL